MIIFTVKKMIIIIKKNAFYKNIQNKNSISIQSCYYYYYYTCYWFMTELTD